MLICLSGRTDGGDEGRSRGFASQHTRSTVKFQSRIQVSNTYPLRYTRYVERCV
jgi:hypothetical protein